MQVEVERWVLVEDLTIGRVLRQDRLARKRQQMARTTYLGVQLVDMSDGKVNVSTLDGLSDDHPLLETGRTRGFTIKSR